MNPAQSVYARASRRFDVSAERVFDAWLDPAKIRDWFGPGLGPMVRIDVEPHVGARFSWVQRRGDKDVEHVGKFLEVDRPRRLAFTFAVPPDPESKVIVDIADRGAAAPDQHAGQVPHAHGGAGSGRGLGPASSAQCEVTVTHEIPPEWAAFVPRSVEAWSKMLDAMSQTV